MESPPIDQLTAALVRAAQRIEQVAPDGVNAHHRYRYATAEAITTAAREALIAEGLITSRAIQRIKIKDGAPWAEIVFGIHHVSGHQRWESCWWPVVEGKGRPLDKAIAVALTSAWKFWLTALLAIPRVQADEDMDSADSGAQTGRSKRQPSPHPRAIAAGLASTGGE